MTDTEAFERFKDHLINGNVKGVKDNLKTEFVERNIDNFFIKRPIHYACEKGYIDIVKLLITKKCNIESETEFKNRPIHLACRQGHSKIVELLIDRKCNIESETQEGWRPIHFACESGHVEVLQLLIQRKCNIESETYDNRRPIHWASLKGHIEIVKLLILHSCKVDVLDFDKRTPLDLAKIKGHQKIVDLIPEADKVTKQICDSILMNDDKLFANLHKPDIHTGKNWLEFAWTNNADKIINYFLDRTIDEFDVRYVKGLMNNNPTKSINTQLWEEILLYKCIRDHHEDGFYFICNANIIGRQRKIIPCSFLELAAKNGNCIFINEIMKKSIFDSDTWNRAKENAVAEGYHHIHESIAKRENLLKWRQKNNVSILHTAVCDNDPDMMEYILSQGLVDPDHNHEVFGTALAFSILLFHCKCLAVLERYSINCDSQNKYLQTPLHEAISNGMIEHCQYLIDNVENIDQLGFMGQTALQCAVMHGCEELCDKLVKKGADCNRYIEISQQLTREKDNTISNDPQLLSQRENSLTLCAKLNKTIYPCFLKSLDRNKANSSDAEGNSLLHLTVKLLQPDICDILIQAGANVDLLNKKGNTPLHDLLFDIDKESFLSNENRIIRTVNLFVQSGCDLKKSLKGDLSILYIISKFNCERLLLALLPPQQNQLFEINENIFTICLDRKYNQFCESVLNLFPKHRLKVSITTKVIEKAIRNDCTHLLKSLIINANDDVQQTATNFSLYHLAQLNDKDSFEGLLNIEINNPILFENGETLLTRLLKENKLDFCEKIFESKTNKKKYINLKNKMNQTPLQVAIEAEAMEVVKNHLIFETETIDNEDRKGRTALMQLFVKISNNKNKNLHLSFLNAIKSIISEGGNIYHETREKRKVIQYCTLPEVTEEIEILFKNKITKFASLHSEKIKETKIIVVEKRICGICLDKDVDSAFECGHTSCHECSHELKRCPFCYAEPINPKRIYFN